MIEVKALLNIYGNNASGYDVLRDFDLVVANSGGSIVLAALAADMKLLDICWAISRIRNGLILFFVDLPWYDLDSIGNLVPGLFNKELLPKYDAAAKLEGLQNALPQLKDTALADLPKLWGGKPNLLITTFDYDRAKAVIFRTDPNSPAASGAAPIPVGTIR